MVHDMQSAPSGRARAEGRETDGDDLQVEPVATVRGDASRTDGLSPAARIERLRRLTLELRVAGLEAKLDRARRRHDEVVEQYENVLEEREDTSSRTGTPVFSWLDRR